MTDELERLRRCGAIPVVELPDPAPGVPLARALVAGGLPVIEVTFRTAGAPEAIAAIRADSGTG